MDTAAEILRAEAPALLVLLASALVALGEWRVHSYNYDYLKTVEAEELIPQLMRRYYLTVVALPWVAFVSSRLLPGSFVFLHLPFVGIALIIASFVLRVWSMRVLGRLWSQRCLYVAGMPRAANGPYRWIRHPEYTARALEGIGFLLFFGLNPLSILLFGRSLLYLARIVKVESRQLYELSPGPLQFDQGSSRVGTSKL